MKNRIHCAQVFHYYTPKSRLGSLMFRWVTKESEKLICTGETRRPHNVREITLLFTISLTMCILHVSRHTCISPPILFSAKIRDSSQSKTLVSNKLVGVSFHRREIMNLMFQAFPLRQNKSRDAFFLWPFLYSLI